MKRGGNSVGHPVDVASGTLYSTYKDFSLDGSFELFWDRYYSTGLREAQGPFGPGWACSLFLTLTRDDAGYAMRDGDGSTVEFEDPKGEVEKGGVIRNLAVFHEIAKRGVDYVVTRWSPDSVDVERLVFRGVVKRKAWPLIAIEDVTGQGLDLEYGPQGELREVRQRMENRSLQVEYGAGARITALHLAVDGMRRDAVMRYEYDARGLLSAAIDAEGHADRFEYDAKGRMTREIAKDGGVFAFRFDDEDRCVRVSGLDGYDAKSLRFLPNIGWTEVTDSTGAVARYQWLPSGQVIVKLDPLGGKRQTEYDDLGRIVKEIDEAGSVTEYGFDAFGNRDVVIDPMGLKAVTVYNEQHLPVEMLDKAGNAWTWKYDARNRLLEARDPIGGVARYEYDGRGNLVGITDQDGDTMRQGFDAKGALAWSSDWEGNVTKLRTDGLGRALETTAPDGAVTRYRYDRKGRLVHVAYADGTARSWEYNPVGIVTAATDPAGRTTRYRIGPCRRILERIDPTGGSVKYVWGSEPGRLRKIINEAGEEYSFDFDAAGRVIHERAFDGREMWFEYDPAGDISATRTAATGPETRFERDAAGRVVKFTLPDGAVHTFAYSPLGDLLAAENPDCKVAFERNPAGRVLKAAQGAHAVEMGFVPGGLRTRFRTTQGLEAVFGFDANERLREVSVNGKGLMRFRRDAEGRETGMLFADRIGLAQRHDALGKLTAQKVFAGAAMDAAGDWSGSNPFADNGPAVLRRAFRYGAPGNLEMIRESAWGDAEYGYDPADRLVRVSRSPGTSESFAFDAAGNLTRMTAGPADASLAYAAGRLIRKGNAEYEYDDQGRLVRKRVDDGTGPAREWRFAWNAMDQLRTVETPDGGLWTYRYDALGRRIAKEGPSGKTEYVWDGNRIVQVLRDGKDHSAWIYAQDGSHRPILTLQGGRAYAVIADHMGTPRELVDEDGNVSWSAVLSGWGTRAGGVDGPECPIRFPGQWFDEETGLHYNRFRYYDPDTGRYISPDPLGPDGGLNLFAYVSNPLTWADVYGWHGNNASSTNPQHVYEIKDNQTGETYKYGISGRPLNQDGSSPRANTQVNALNNNPSLAAQKTGEATDTSRFGPGKEDRFTATLVKKDIQGDSKGTAREKALALEQKKVDKFYDKNGRRPNGNDRPKATKEKGCGS
jgi:RHS repeat-associated protein